MSAEFVLNDILHTFLHTFLCSHHTELQTLLFFSVHSNWNRCWQLNLLQWKQNVVWLQPKNILHGIFIWTLLYDHCRDLNVTCGGAGVRPNHHLSNGRKGQLNSWAPRARTWCSVCVSPFPALFSTYWQALFAARLSYVPYTYGNRSGGAPCCSPWAALESLTAIIDRMDNKHEIVTISNPCQKNISDMGYKQRPLISEGPYDFKQPDSSCLVGTVGAGQGNMMK